MTKSELAAIVAELDADLKKGEAEVTAQLKKAAEAPLKEDSSSPADESAQASAPAEAPEATEAPAPAPEGSEAPMAPPAPEGSEAPVDPAAAGGEQAQLTPEALQAEYAQLSPEELDMHLQAAMAAKEALAATAGPGPGAPGAPAPMAPPAGAPPAPPAPMMGKEEMKINAEASGGKISKSESDLAALVKSQSEDIEILTKAVRTILETPVRKGLTSIADIQPMAKSEVKTLGRKEVNDFIKENAHKMTKSERDLWLNFTDNKVPASKLAPMLERLSSK